MSKSINSRADTTVLAIFAPGVTYFLETAVPAAALTIDDGPDPDETPAILDVLRDHDAHATFFLIGSRIPGNDPLLATREDVDDPQLCSQIDSQRNKSMLHRLSLMWPRVVSQEGPSLFDVGP